MPIQNYPFTPVASDIMRPMLWIRLSNPDYPKSSVRYSALVDTGADDCVFPAGVAIALGHNLTSVTPKIIHGINSASLSYPHTSTIEILGMDSDYLPTTDVLYTVAGAPIDYLVGCQNFLLGAKKFLSDFILTVDYPQKVFSIQHPAKN